MIDLETIDKVIEVSEETDLPCDIFENKFLYHNPKINHSKSPIGVSG